jgi:predicted PurR-regulated permease PerM
MSKRKRREFPIPNLIISVLALLLALASLGFSIYVYEISTRPTTLSSLVESRLKTIQSELQSAEQRLLDVRPDDGNLTRLQEMVDQAKVLYGEAVHDWVQFNLEQSEHEALQAENIIHEFNQEVQPEAGGKTNIGVIFGPIVIVIVIALVAYWFLSRRKPPPEE